VTIALWVLNSKKRSETQMKQLSKSYLFFFVLLLSFANISVAQNFEQKQIDKILSLEIDSSINPAGLNYLKTGYIKAQKDQYDAILLKLNTPGGLVSTTKEILTLMGEATIPTIIWVTPEGGSATSAGAIISAGAHLLYMSTGTNIGAATPIGPQGDLKEGDSKNKAINDLVGLVVSLSETRGRAKEGFKNMIEKAASYTAKEALKKNLIDGLVNTEKELGTKINNSLISLRGQKVKLTANNPHIVFHPMDSGQKLLNILANPSLLYILFVIGAALIYLELQAPGGFLAGGIGLFLLILSGIGFQVLPLNFGALGLMVLSFVLFILEAYITSYGILTLAGLASLVTGSLFLFRTDNVYIHFSKTVIISTTSAIAVFLIFITSFIIKDYKRRKNKSNDSFFEHKGKMGIVTEILADHGSLHYYHIKIAGEIWKASSSKQYKLQDDVMILEDDKDNMSLKI
jgi:membrane-bound serine protease (ClpP class)